MPEGSAGLRGAAQRNRCRLLWTPTRKWSPHGCHTEGEHIGDDPDSSDQTCGQSRRRRAATYRPPSRTVGQVDRSSSTPPGPRSKRRPSGAGARTPGRGRNPGQRHHRRSGASGRRGVQGGNGGYRSRHHRSDRGRSTPSHSRNSRHVCATASPPPTGVEPWGDGPGATSRGSGFTTAGPHTGRVDFISPALKNTGTSPRSFTSSRNASTRSDRSSKGSPGQGCSSDEVPLMMSSRSSPSAGTPPGVRFVRRRGHFALHLRSESQR